MFFNVFDTFLKDYSVKTQVLMKAMGCSHCLVLFPDGTAEASGSLQLYPITTHVLRKDIGTAAGTQSTSEIISEYFPLFLSIPVFHHFCCRE